MFAQEAFIFLLINEDANILSWIKKFINDAFIKGGGLSKAKTID